MYWEVDEDGRPLMAGLPKDRYALNCRPDQYVPHSFMSKGLYLVLHIAIEGK